MVRLPLFTCLVTRAMGRALVYTVAANIACENKDNARENMATNRTVRKRRTFLIYLLGASCGGTFLGKGTEYGRSLHTLEDLRAVGGRYNSKLRHSNMKPR